MTSYFDGVGTYSYTEIVEAAKLSGLLGPDPLLRDTSDLRDQPAPYHGTGNAVDFGDDQQNGSPQQDAFAHWVAATYGPYSLEIIHVCQDGSTVEWKFGKRMPSGWYGADTLAAHHNHVHWAITIPGLTAGLPKGLGKMPTINLNGPLNMQDPVIRTAQALLGARGGMISPNNASHAIFKTVLSWFHQQTGLADDGIFGDLTWARVVKPLNGK